MTALVIAMIWLGYAAGVAITGIFDGAHGAIIVFIFGIIPASIASYFIRSINHLHVNKKEEDG